MSASVTATYSGTLTHLLTVLAITCDDVSNNDSTAFDADEYPTEPEIKYYFSIEKTGQDSLVSPVFSTNVEGQAAWYGVIIPAAGTWTLRVRKDSDDSSVCSASLVTA